MRKIILICSYFLTITASFAWEFEKDEDKMRNEALTYIIATSENQHEFNFPYQGGSSLRLIVRKKNGKLDALFFKIDKGQLTCGMGCKATVKFLDEKGDGKLETVTLDRSANHNSKLAFVSKEAPFFEKIKSHSKVIVELPFYSAGNVQFTFDLKNIPKEF